MEIFHNSVLLDEAVEALCVKPDGTYVDATLGGGGHALEIVSKLDGGLLVGIDRDPFAIERAAKTLAPYLDKTKIVRAAFSQIDYIMAEADISQADGVLMDLGVSSFQLGDGRRGFSYNHDAPLDMRMDTGQALTAFDVINDYDEKDLARIFRDYGEEKWARRIAKFIVARRGKDPVETTLQLVEIIKAAIPRGARSDGPHPAKRVFQAIRIEVNDELAVLKQALENFIKILRPKGRICVITFHSLEDRLVKSTFRKLASPCTCPREFPRCFCGKTPVVEVVTKKPIVPSGLEIEANHRARSAKLRVAQKLSI